MTTLADAAEVAEREGVRSPAVVVVGEVVRIREQVGDLVPPSLLADAAPTSSCSPTARRTPATPPAWRRSPSRSGGARPGHVHAAYLDHHPPSATEVAKRLDGGVLVPLLLTTAYHVKTDVPEAAAAMDALGRGRYAVAACARSGPPALHRGRRAAGPRGLPARPAYRRGALRRRVVRPRSHQRDRRCGRRTDPRRLGPVGSGGTGGWGRRGGGRGPAAGRGSPAGAGRDLHGRRGRAARPDGHPRREGRRRGRAGDPRPDRRPRRPPRAPRAGGAARRSGSLRPCQTSTRGSGSTTTARSSP